MSDGAVLKVSFVALDGAHADLGRAITLLGTELDDLDRAAQPLVATWKGAAQEAYSQHQAAWTRSANDLKNVLANIQRALGRALEEYRAAETRNAHQFR